MSLSWARGIGLIGPSARTSLATAGLAVVLFVSLGVFAVVAARLAVQAVDDRTIRQLGSGFDIEVTAASDPRVVFARVHFLLLRDRLDEARPLVERIIESDTGGLAAPALYDLANADLRRALDLLEQNRIDPAVAEVRLAKNAYRQALVLDPDFWNAKYNLDIAMRLVRDFPQIEAPLEEPPPGAQRRPWTDLPGLPKGLP